MTRKSKFGRPLSAIAFMLVLTGLAACTSAPPVKPHDKPHSHAETKAVAPASVKHRSPSRGALAVAANMIGTPYRYGGASPRGFDCSGLVQYAYSQVGVQAPRSTKEQYRQIRRIRVSELRPGDLVFFKLSGNRVSHVGIYAGDDRFIHSPSSGKSVSYASLRNPYWKKRIAGAGRLP
ncbi:hypothetical protein MNBD_GAMMA15-1620 [hydrothermal vent metagenome]|uniref:NlpC/P60 domain-containing protein n=1 Tax=hydrothermal vent metagenome TaxID=652676 RepID=A0A3B0YA77_9ZZZZ